MSKSTTTTKKTLRTALILTAAVGGTAQHAGAQLSLSSPTYSQNFDGLGTGNVTVTGGNLGSHSSTLTGWYFSEAGSNANTTLTAGTGSSSTGDTFNFGAASGSDRALGGLRSGSLIPTIGLYLTNNTGRQITGYNLSYTGETWRVGTANRSDRLDFQYSTTATGISSGTFTDLDALDYANPGQATGSGSVQHSAAISGSVSSLTMAQGSSIVFRWTDFDATSADDGMGIDDFNATATFSTQTVTWNTTTGNWNQSTKNFQISGTPTFFQNGDTAVFGGASGGVVTIVAGGVAPAATNFTNTAGTYEVTGGAITAGNITKSGAGTLILSGTNTYTGTTTINNGTLLVNGTHTGGGDYTVNTNGTLGGSGSTSSTLYVLGGNVAPGESIGNLTVGGALFGSGSDLTIEVSAPNASTATGDKLVSTDLVDLGAGDTTLNLVMLSSYIGPNSATIVIVNNTSATATTGYFAGKNPGMGTTFSVTDGLLQYVINYAHIADGDSVANDIAITFTQVPEPTALGVLALGGLLTLRRRR